MWRTIGILATLLAVPLAARPASAGTAVVNFVVPQTTDPTKITFISEGSPLEAPPGQLVFGLGAELHGRVPGTTPGTWADVTQVTIQFTLPGDVVLATGGSDVPGFARWTWTITKDGDLWTIVFTKPPDGAPINDAFCLNGGPPNCVPSSALIEIFVDNDPTNSSIVGPVTFAATKLGEDRPAGAPVVTVGTNRTTLWPPNGKMVPVVISGNISNPLGDIDPSTAMYTLVDEYGVLSGSGKVTLQQQPDGSYTYSFTLPLQASRLGSDLDGRLYTITVQVAETGGSISSATSTVTVPHDQR